MTKINYLKRALVKKCLGQGKSCPNCKSTKSYIVDRKYFLFHLRRCSSCFLQFRTPTDNVKNNQSYYEEEYDAGTASALPSEETITKLKQGNFEGFDKNYDFYISVLKTLAPDARYVLDFGGSWGYGSLQLQQAGYQVTGYEVARNRRQIARGRLEIPQIDSIENTIMEKTMYESFDVVFSSHVVEHLPNPGFIKTVVDHFLRSGGIFISFTPNGSDPARCSISSWSKLWGEVHPNFIDDRFYQKLFCNWPRIVSSEGIFQLDDFPIKPFSVQTDNLAGRELIFVAQKPSIKTCRL